MEITTLNRLMDESEVICNPDGLIVTIHPSWVVEGEDRLSYTTLVRLVECCREYHWQNDILPKVEDNPVDSICKSLSARFINPVPVGSVISITYRVTNVRSKGYSLKFEILNVVDQILCAEFDVVSIFYDSVTHMPVAPPVRIREYLSNIGNHQ